MNKPSIYNNKGFTLMEVIVVLALIGIVLGGTFSVVALGNNTNRKGNQQYNIQSDVRRISDIISDDIKYSVQIQILPEVPKDTDGNEIFTSGFNYIYLGSDKDDKDVEYVAIKKAVYDASSNKYNITTIASKKNTKIDYTLKFESGETNITKATISGDDGTQHYEIVTNIDLLNADIAPVDLSNTGSAICYRAANVPIASQVVINGSPISGSILTGSYCYDDALGIAESSSGSIYKWYVCTVTDDLNPIPQDPNDPAFNWQPMDGATGLTYTVLSSDVSKVLCFEVTPKSVDNICGTPVKSPPMKIEAIAKPTIDSFSIQSNGNTLYVNISIHAADGSTPSPDNTMYTWYRSNNSKRDKNDTIILSVIGAAGSTYNLTDDDKGKYIYCKIIPASTDNYGYVISGDEIASTNSVYVNK